MPDTSTEVALASTTLSTTATSITFSSISSAYTDLVVVLTALGNSPYQPAIRLNSDTGSNYHMTEMWGDGSSGSQAIESAATYINAARGAVLDTTHPSLVKYHIFSYPGSLYKTVITEYAGDRNGSGVVERTVGTWLSTSAVNSITLMSANGSQTMTAGTTATLYGIL